MKKINSLLMFLFLTVSVIISSCKKDKNIDPDQGQMLATLDNVTSLSLNAKADSFHYINSLQGPSFALLRIEGLYGTEGIDYTSLSIEIRAVKIEAKVYDIPKYSANYNYDYEKGFVLSTFSWLNPRGSKSQRSDRLLSYETYYRENVSGTVTIESILTNSIKGTYNMTLQGISDKTKTVYVNGSFNTKLVKGSLNVYGN